MTEYEACIIGLQAALDLNIRDVDVYGDSTLIICQAVGEWRTKDPKLVPYHRYLEERILRFRRKYIVICPGQRISSLTPSTHGRPVPVRSDYPLKPDKGTSTLNQTICANHSC